MEESATQFAAILQRLRLRANLSQADLAAASGLPVRTIQGYEAGRREPSWSAVCKLAKAMKLKLTAFALR